MATNGELGCLCGKAGTSHLCDGSAHSSGCVVNGTDPLLPCLYIQLHLFLWYVLCISAECGRISKPTSTTAIVESVLSLVSSADGEKGAHQCLLTHISIGLGSIATSQLVCSCKCQSLTNTLYSKIYLCRSSGSSSSALVVSFTPYLVCNATFCHAVR